MSLDITGLGSVFEFGKDVIDKIFPDANKRAEEMRKLEELKQQGDIAQMQAHVQLLLAQIDVNKTEAQSKSFFIAAWRPFIGWIGGLAMAYQFLGYPLLIWFWAYGQAREWIPLSLQAPPVLNTDALFAMVTAMLGIGAMRSYDKTKGTQTDKI